MRTEVSTTAQRFNLRNKDIFYRQYQISLIDNIAVGFWIESPVVKWIIMRTEVSTTAPRFNLHNIEIFYKPYQISLIDMVSD